MVSSLELLLELLLERQLELMIHIKVVEIFGQVLPKVQFLALRLI